MYKADGNFFNHFYARDIPGYNIKLGSQPSLSDDFENLCRLKNEPYSKDFDIVLNIENEEDYLKRNITKSYVKS